MIEGDEKPGIVILHAQAKRLKYLEVGIAHFVTTDE